MKKTINLKSPEGEIKKFRIDENPIFWKVLGVFMVMSGIITLYRAPYKESVCEKIYNVLEGVLTCYLGLYDIREFAELRKLIIKSWVMNKGYAAADEEAEKYLNEKILKKE